MENLNEIIEKYRTEETTLVSVLQDIDEAYGYLPEEIIRTLSEQIDVPLSLLYSLATFYTSFRFEPRGKHHVCVCVGTACHVKGAPKVVDTVERALKIPPGGTTEDMQFTFETVNCLGACALGPLVVADDEYHGKMDQKKTERLLTTLNEQSSETPEETHEDQA